MAASRDLRILAFSWNSQSHRLCESLDLEVVKENRRGYGEELLTSYLGVAGSYLPKATRYQLSCEIADFMDQLGTKIKDEAPDLIVISSQEDSSPGSYLHSNLLPNLMRDVYKYEFINRTRLLGIGRSTFNEAQKQYDVRELKTRGLRMSVYATERITNQVEVQMYKLKITDPKVLTSYYSCNNVYGKGGISIYVPLSEDVVLCFIDLHLPFNAKSLIDTKKYNDQMIRQDAISEQNVCFNSLIRELVSNDSLLLKPTSVIVMGDLNYRLRYTPNPDASFVANDLLNNPSIDNIKKYLEYDELRQEIEKRNIYSCSEGVGNQGPLFLPTCKMRFEANPDPSGSDKRMHSTGCQFNGGKADNCWNLGKENQRIPSWCDRILYFSVPGSPSVLICTDYNRFDFGETMRLSDHAGVYALFSLVLEGGECIQVMCQEGIYNKKDFLKWSVKNHPDKGGNNALFQRVSPCNDRGVYCPGRK